MAKTYNTQDWWCKIVVEISTNRICCAFWKLKKYDYKWTYSSCLLANMTILSGRRQFQNKLKPKLVKLKLFPKYVESKALHADVISEMNQKIELNGMTLFRHDETAQSEVKAPCRNMGLPTRQKPWTSFSKTLCYFKTIVRHHAKLAALICNGVKPTMTRVRKQFTLRVYIGPQWR